MSPSDAPSLCPLCGGANACSVAAGADPAGCWCMHQRIDPRVLERIAPAARGQRCVCATCAVHADATTAAKPAPAGPSF